MEKQIKKNGLFSDFFIYFFFKKKKSVIRDRNNIGTKSMKINLDDCLSI